MLKFARGGSIRQLTLGLVIVAMAAPASLAAYDLQITELWMGNEPGSNLTADWVEITNYGDTAWTAATDGDIYFDDDSADVADAEIMSGIVSIAPGESVVYVNDFDTFEWLTVWSGVLSSVPQVGIHDGKGLGQGGDAMTLFLDDLAPGVNLTQIDYEGYPDANAFGGQSYDVPLGAFSIAGNAAGAVSTTVLNDEDQPAIGSPGSVVPEPATIGLLAMGAFAVVRRRR